MSMLSRHRDQFLDADLDPIHARGRLTGDHGGMPDCLRQQLVGSTCEHRAKDSLVEELPFIWSHGHVLLQCMPCLLERSCTRIC